jgi:hypothetical protein
MMARPWSPSVPLAMMASPGTRPLSRTGRSVTPMPEVLIAIPSSDPCSRTFVSPVTRAAPLSLRAASIDATIRSRTGISKPSSMSIPQERAIGRAPIIARSLTVPQTAMRPISPPGKKSGFTTWESVVNAICSFPIGMTAPSSSDSRPIPPALLFVYRVSVAPRSSEKTAPPAPCIILTFIRHQLRFQYWSQVSRVPRRSPAYCRTADRHTSQNRYIRTCTSSGRERSWRQVSPL